MDIILDFFFMYNTILHSTVALVNIGIIVKEIELEFFEVFTIAGGHGSDYNMSMDFAKKALYDDVWFLDPTRVISYLWFLIFGWHLSDIWNPNTAMADKKDEVYIANWGK